MASSAVALLAALIAGASYMAKKDAEAPIENAGTAQNAAVKQESLTYDGQEYPMKPHLQTVLLIGTDSTEGYEEVTEGVKPFYNRHQADFLMLLVMDAEQNTAELLQLNRGPHADRVCRWQLGQLRRQDRDPGPGVR